MRTGTFAVLAVLVGSIAAESVATAQDFKTYASSAGRYKVLFPGGVKTDTVEVPAGTNKLTVTIDTVELRGGVSFLVTFVDAPDDVAKQPAAGRFGKVRDANKGADGKVVEEKDVTVGEEKYPARDLLIEKKDVFLRNRVVIAGNRLYQVMVQGPKDVVTSPSADRFLASFEITK